MHLLSGPLAKLIRVSTSQVGLVCVRAFIDSDRNAFLLSVQLSIEQVVFGQEAGYRNKIKQLVN